MSSIHVASAANEVAQALPSTATVTVSKHGIQAVETLKLEAQNASPSQLSWTRTFSGLEVLTNPTLHFQTKTVVPELGGNLSHLMVTLTQFRKWREHIRLTSDPIANASSSINVTINNASLSIQPARTHRIVTTTFPDEHDVAHQRKHYGLNQLDQFAESQFRKFQEVAWDDVEKQHNANSLRENYPQAVSVKYFKTGLISDQADLWGPNTGSELTADISESDYSIPVVMVRNPNTSGAIDVTTPILWSKVIYKGMDIGYIALGSDLQDNETRTCMIVKDNTQPKVPADIDLSLVNPADLTIVDNVSGGTTTFVNSSLYVVSCDNVANLGILETDTSGYSGSAANTTYYLARFTEATIKSDVYAPLAHPYFRDNVMRDNTLVNVRYFDCQINIDNPKRLVEVAHLNQGVYDNRSLVYTTEIDLTEHPELWFDLVTPSVPLPTISDKVIKTYHTIESEALTKTDRVQSGNIQLAQVPDKIYVFVRSEKDLATYTNDALHVPTRLGVITNVRVRTPQNSAFLINMDQESLYQMSCRNGSKQSRSAFMCSLGSVLCIDPEKDLGGYTNGVLVPFTFEIDAEYSLPLADTNTKSRIKARHLKNQVVGWTRDYDATEKWSLFVVCEMQGHLYLMSDGTGKQTKSNLTVTEVADAVADGLHHPTTFPGGRVSKMDAGLLSEVGKASGVDDAGVRAALRA